MRKSLICHYMKVNSAFIHISNAKKNIKIIQNKKIMPFNIKYITSLLTVSILIQVL